MDTNKLKPFLFYSTNGNQLTTDPYVIIFETRNPTPQDVNYPQQKQWLNTTINKLWILTSFNTTTGTVLANWTDVSSAVADVNSLTGDDLVPVTPVNNNIDLIGSATGAFETASGGSGIMEGSVKVDGTTITINGSNQLTVNNGGVHWQVYTTNLTLADSKGYILQSPGGALVLGLPATSSIGSTVEIVLDGATSFTINQLAGQQIDYLTFSSTVGVAGSVASTTQGNYVKMTCVQANLRWRILTATGSITLT